MLDVCKKNIPRSKRQRVFRAKFSSIAPKDIQIAFRELRKEPDWNESLSVDARQIMDLKIGVAFSRIQSMRLGKLFSGRDKRMITYGPC